MLSLMNVAFVQLHPNSWAFLHPFQIMCMSLKIEPIVNKFVYFYLFVQIHYMYWFSFSIEKLLHLIKFGESFSLGSLLNQPQTYQGNPCGVYHDLSSFTGSGIIQNSITYIKWSAPSKDHIMEESSREPVQQGAKKSTCPEFQPRGWSLWEDQQA